ncbi:MAG: hypothetical protein MPK06_01825 [Alphaproteobacteria bacterium]|nr:hypothetical protein [Alphaproteobacteria bacterium]MDA8005267.1 hypothetical protein [Alphaproteobacteria bacterium]MDA8012686.1 hypothetical protein [Alphaproteobacteria bacterium]
MSRELAERIEGADVFYINLGLGSYLANRCIKNGCMMIGFPEHPHDEIKNLDAMPSSTLEKFYRNNDALWVTYWNMRLWWTFVEKGAEVDAENAGHPVRELKERKVVGWRDKSLDGEVLYLHRLGYMPRYGRTICEVSGNAGYLKDVICGTGAREGEKCLISRLDENQIEWFTEKLFCEMGWERISPVGGTQKNIDLIMEHKENHSLAFIQVKSKGTMGYWAEVVRLAYGFSQNGASEDRKAKFYLVYNKPPHEGQGNLDLPGLEEYTEYLLNETKPDHRRKDIYGENLDAVDHFKGGAPKVSVESWGQKDLAEKAVDCGLSDWLRERVDLGRKKG